MMKGRLGRKGGWRGRGRGRSRDGEGKVGGQGEAQEWLLHTCL